MDENEMHTTLYEKVSAEYKDFIADIKKQNSVDIAIESAYEIVWKDNISQYLENENPDLSDEQYNALLSSKNTLDELYTRFLKEDGIDSYSDLGFTFEDTANRLIEITETERQAQMTAHMTAPLILHDYQTALSFCNSELNDYSALDDYRISGQENIACAKAIIAAKEQNTTCGDMAGVTHFNAEKTLDDVLNKGFSAERLGYVIANQVVRDQNYLENPRIIDGRFSGKVKDWAIKTFSQQENLSFENFRGCDLTYSIHHVLVNDLAEKFIEKQLELSAEAEKNTSELGETRETKTEKKPSVLGEIGKIKAERETKKAEKPVPQKAKSHGQEIE
ncbi:MAG: DUF3848 domain-containing protein [Eubacterium sp.]|nr:DUF3848 domain-containing protein [Eubacterium sp.]